LAQSFSATNSTAVSAHSPRGRQRPNHRRHQFETAVSTPQLHLENTHCSVLRPATAFAPLPTCCARRSKYPAGCATPSLDPFKRRTHSAGDPGDRHSIILPRGALCISSLFLTLATNVFTDDAAPERHHVEVREVTIAPMASSDSLFDKDTIPCRSGIGRPDHSAMERNHGVYEGDVKVGCRVANIFRAAC
jgi:hypothetical protein